ncbi:DCL family protein [Pseudomonas aeruginosa]|uniref:DCL family protein n=1 Tax=Pseudomonas aeruginosa TaxID=287 RepID=UPI0017F7AE6D|nr:DCL family protein [Pseudomonas aeruginosa]MBA4994322.1 DCL family protein [Pseudomonas aeruginosa]HBP0512555.1 DCL family protein [Pseudomonas aeruginosa]HEO1760174.1 DCL family protein [Pseudomonas aeruginosa]
MYWLGPFQYSSKQELLERLKVFVATAPVGRVSHKIAIQKLHLLIALHPDAERKIGSGVDHFKIERNVLGAGQGLRLVRSDGTEESFSYKRCITGVRQSSYGKVCEALRFSVRSQLIAFRETLRLPTKCAISGEDIVHRSDLHIDHKIPFWRLLLDFSETHRVDLTQLDTVGSGEALALVDQEISEAFEAFHLTHAELQPSSKTANALKGGRLKFPDAREDGFC